MTGEVTEELRDIYHCAYDDGIWLCEWGPAHGGQVYAVAAGSVKALEEIEKRTGKKIDASKLTLADVVDISLPGIGTTREEACRNAIRGFKKYKKRNTWV